MRLAGNRPVPAAVGAQATVRTMSRWPRRPAAGEPSAASHRVAVQSSPPVARLVPSGLQAREVRALPVGVRVRRPLDPRRGVPDLERAVLAGRGDRVPLRAPGQGVDPGGVPRSRERSDGSAPARSRSAFIAAPGQAAAVGAPRHRGRRRRRAGDRPRSAADLAVPDEDPRLAGPGQAPTVGAPGQGADDARVVAVDVHHPVALQVPDRDDPVVAAGREASAVGVPGEGADGPLVIGIRPGGPSRPTSHTSRSGPRRRSPAGGRPGSTPRPGPPRRGPPATAVPGGPARGGTTTPSRGGRPRPRRGPARRAACRGRHVGRLPGLPGAWNRET